MTSGRKRAAPGSGRYAFLLGVLTLALAIVGGRLVYLHAVEGPAFAQKATNQRTRDIKLAPHRGSIYDRDGEPLAVSPPAKTVYASPRGIEDVPAAAAALAGVLGGDVAGYEAKLRKDTGFVYIARKIDLNRAAALAALDIKGIGLLEDSKRSYPAGELACQVLGFVGVDDLGLSGLELQYDDLLAGEPGVLLAERDAFGGPIPGGVKKSIPPVDGQNLVLTIDKDIQHETQVALDAAVEEWGAKGGTIVVMDPRDGEILAMASSPGFNPNRYGEAEPAALRNSAICDTYEPGSTVKSLTAASVIDKGLFVPESAFVLPPTIKVGGRTIGEAHGRPTVTWTLTDIVTNSSNVGAVKLGLALGPLGLYEYFDKFGLTERTGVDFPGEAKGWLPPTSAWSASTIGTVPFGQGISMTPLQLARALSAIAAGGEMPTPHFLGALPDDPDTHLVWPRTRAISAEAAALTREILKAVVTEGTGGNASVPGYAVAGKTGTAQKVRTDGVPGYATGKYVASFSGFLPADDPQVLIIVSIDEPSNSIYGGTVAAPAFARVAAFAVSHLKIPPTIPGSIDETATAAPAP